MIRIIYFHFHSSFYTIIHILYTIWKYNIYFRILKYLSQIQNVNLIKIRGISQK